MPVQGVWSCRDGGLHVPAGSGGRASGRPPRHCRYCGGPAHQSPRSTAATANLNLEARMKASYRPSSSVLRRDSESLRGSDREGARRGRPWGYRDDPDMGSLRGLRLRNCTIQFQHVGMGCRVRLGGLYCRKCVEPRTRSSILSNILTHSVAKLMAEVETSSGCTNKPRAAHSEGSQDQQCTGACSGYLRPSSCACM